MKKLFATLVTMLALAPSPAFAQLSLPQNYNNQIRNTSRFYRAAVITTSPYNGQPCAITGTAYRLAAPVTSSTGGAVTNSLVLPANSLVSTPSGLRIRVRGACAANANTKTVTFAFGSTNVTLLNAAANATDFYADISVYRTGASTQRISVAGYANGALLSGLSVNSAQAEGSTITISVVLATATANSDVTLDSFEIQGEASQI